MSPFKKVVTQRQRDNLLEALHVMWPSVPPENVTLDLALYSKCTSARTSCRTIACFGGWCARWPNFVAQGVRLSPFGIPLTRDGEAPAFVSKQLFGHPGLFLARGQLPPDGAATSDHDCVTKRLEWLLRTTQLASDMEDDPS